MNRALIFLLTLALGAASSTHVAATGDEPTEGPAAPWLAERDSRSFDSLRIDPETRLDGFNAFFVESPTVTFRKHWQRDQNRYGFKVRDRDAQRIQTDTAALFKDAITAAFTDAGHVQAEAPGPGVLVIRPAIEDLDIIAPDVPTATRRDTYSQTAGSMTLTVVAEDGADGRILLVASEDKRDPRREFFEWRTRPYNTAIARRMMRSFASDLQSVVDNEHWLVAAH